VFERETANKAHSHPTRLLIVLRGFYPDSVEVRGRSKERYAWTARLRTFNGEIPID